MRLLALAAAHRRTRRPTGPAPGPTLPEVAVGQAQFDTYGTFTWKCPEGVTSISVALVGGGGKGVPSNTGISRYRGNGANMRYINNVPVVPGRNYTLVVGPRGGSRFATDSSAFGYSTSDSISGVVKGADGSRTTGYVAGTTATYGGNVGGVTAGWNGNGINLKTFQANRRTTDLGGMAAGGGGGVQGAGGFGYGGHGAIRIIWGDNRAFPNQNIGDL